MMRRLQIGLAVLAIALLGASLAGWIWLRLRDARLYSQPHQVQRGGTNYIIQLQKTTLGRAGTNCLLLLQVRLQNPNPFELRLERRSFGLVDHDKDYYQPSLPNPQAATIVVPAHGVAERETLSYSLPPDSFAGTLALYAGQYYFLLVKEQQPYQPTMREGEFVSFQRRQW